MDPLHDPRVAVDQYIIRPSCYDDLAEHEKSNFGLVVMNGHEWGWSVRWRSHWALNRKGEHIFEQRGSRSNRFRRWPLEEALTIALKHVDSQKINGRTAQEWVDFWATRKEEK